MKGAQGGWRVRGGAAGVRRRPPDARRRAGMGRASSFAVAGYSPSASVSVPAASAGAGPRIPESKTYFQDPSACLRQMET